MRTAIYMLAAVAVSGLATAGTHGAGHSQGHTAAPTSRASPGTTASTVPTVAAANPMSPGTTAGTVNTAGDPSRPPGISTPVNQPTIPPPSATQTPPPGVTPLPAQSTRHDRMTDRQAQMTDQRMVNPGQPRGNTANFQQRIPPASRGVGTPGKPDCSRMRGIDKADCERRDTVRDDLPAGVTTTQPEK